MDAILVSCSFGPHRMTQERAAARPGPLPGPVDRVMCIQAPNAPEGGGTQAPTDLERLGAQEMNTLRARQGRIWPPAGENRLAGPGPPSRRGIATASRRVLRYTAHASVRQNPRTTGPALATRHDPPGPHQPRES
jgi:hypothetical protein